MSTVVVTTESLLKEVKKIPTVPAVIEHIINLVEQDDTTAKVLSAAIEHDVGLSTRVLGIANCAFFGLAYKVANVQQAIVVLGFAEIKRLTQSIVYKQRLQSMPVWDVIDAKQFWRHCLAAATAAKMMSTPFNQSPVDAFTVGLLHELGKCALALCAPDQYSAALRDVKLTASNAEEYYCGLSQAQAGEFLCAQWQLPQYITRAIAAQTSECSEDRLAELLRLANDVALNAGFPHVGKNQCERREPTAQVVIPLEQIQSVESTLPEAVAEIEHMFLTNE